MQIYSEPKKEFIWSAITFKKKSWQIIVKLIRSASLFPDVHSLTDRLTHRLTDSRLAPVVTIETYEHCAAMIQPLLNPLDSLQPLGLTFKTHLQPFQSTFKAYPQPNKVPPQVYMRFLATINQPWFNLFGTISLSSTSGITSKTNLQPLGITFKSI